VPPLDFSLAKTHHGKALWRTKPRSVPPISRNLGHLFIQVQMPLAPVVRYATLLSGAQTVA